MENVLLIVCIISIVVALHFCAYYSVVDLKK